MASVKLTWRGDELIERLTEADDDALYEIAQALIEEARPRAPVRRGALRESGYAASNSKSSYRKRDRTYRKEIKPQKGQAVAAFAAFYAKFIELGTRKLSARPYLRPALDANKERLAAAGVDVWRKRVNK